MPSKLKEQAQAKAKAKQEKEQKREPKEVDEEEDEGEDSHSHEEDEDEDGDGEETKENIPSIEPYTVLGLDRSATADQVKSAYRKAALKSHPDKAPAHQKEEAHTRFQEVALAYAILSDERRRKRYDTTGNTGESLDLDDDDDFSWVDFFREQSAAVVDGSLIDQIRREYQGSEEEHEDLLQAYEQHKGNMDAVYEVIMCSNVLEDDERFRRIIDSAIADGSVQSYPAYAGETKDSRRKRKREAEREADEAIALAEELGVSDRLFGNGKKGGKGSKGSKGKTDDGEDGLKALIQQRQQSRAASFFDQLEAKYGSGQTKQKKAAKKGKSR